MFKYRAAEDYLKTKFPQNWYSRITKYEYTSCDNMGVSGSPHLAGNFQRLKKYFY